MAAAADALADEEQPIISSSSDSEVQPSWSGRRVAKVVIATGCLVACIAGASVWGKPQRTSARMLIESSEMADVMSKNLIKVGIAHHGDEVALHEVATSQLRKLTDDLDSKDEATYKYLDSLMLTKEQKDHIMQKIYSLSDSRMQKFGEQVVKIVLENKDKKPDEIEAALKDKFSARLPELRQLQEKLLPNAKAMKKHMNQTRLMKDMLKHKTERRLAEPKVILADVAQVITGLLEQARVALDQTDFLGDAFGKDLHISPYTKSIIGAVDYVAEVGECIHRALPNLVKEGLCPMKYASAGADALECIDNMLGVDNSNFALHSAPAATTPAPAVSSWGKPAAPAPPVSPWGQPVATQNALGDGWTR